MELAPLIRAMAASPVHSSSAIARMPGASSPAASSPTATNGRSSLVYRAAVSRKLGAPGHREYGIGAIALGGASVLDQDAVRALGITPSQLAEVEAEERTELERQRRRFRGDEPAPDLRDRTVIIVDDGLATGVSALAAVRATRAFGASRIILAIPVCAPETLVTLRSQVDDLVCVASPPNFHAVGLWYRDFTQTSDETVIQLRKQWQKRGGAVAEQPKTDTAGSPTIGVAIPAVGVRLDGDLTVPVRADGVVLFAHGSGSSRHSPRNRYVAAVLQEAGLATLLLDLLTPAEEAIDLQTGQLRFDIELLPARLVAAIDWLASDARTANLVVGCFGASTGGAAALAAAAVRTESVRAVVSRGGRPDLAGDALTRVRAPTLLIVGGSDTAVISLNEQALERLQPEKQLVIVPGATHMFEEPGAMEQVARLAACWFGSHLSHAATSTGRAEHGDWLP